MALWVINLKNLSTDHFAATVQLHSGGVEKFVGKRSGLQFKLSLDPL